MALQHLRSSTANKRPLPAGMSDGQLAINTNLASPGLFLKNSNGDLVKVGPVHVGTTAPNVSPAAGGETGNTTGELWLDTSLTPNELKTWNGSAWVSATGQEIPVSKLIDGSARQLLQTDAAGTGVEWTSNVDVPGTLDVTSTATFDSIAQYPLGSAGAPTLTFTGDTNTGIYSPGADQVAISTGGSGRLFIDSIGNIGVGTSTPASNGSTFGTLSLNGSNGGAQHFMSAGNTVMQLYNDANAFFVNANTNKQIIVQTGGSERLRITDAGLVGVGTSSPSTRLHLNSADASANYLRVENTGGYALFGVDGSGNTYAGAESNDAFGLVTNGTYRMYITAGGNVGIGTSSPSVELSIAGSDPQLVLWEGSDGASSSKVQLGTGLVQGFINIHKGDGTRTVQISSDDTSYFNGGNVGIGTTGPQGLLHLQQSLSDSVPILALGEASNNVRYSIIQETGYTGISHGNTNIDLKFKTFASAGTGGTISFWTGSTSASERARLDSSGRLLVGTSTASGYSSSRVIITGAGTDPTGASNLVLQIGQANGSVTVDEQIGVIAFGDTSGYSYANIVAAADLAAGSDSPGRLVFSTTANGASSPTERMRINSVGTHSFLSTGSTAGIMATSSGAGTGLAVLACRHSASSTTTGTNSMLVYSNGNVVNTNNSYGAISDLKLKENIVDASSQWDDLKALRVRNYNLKEGQTHTQIGLIAQEVELVSPGLVSESPDRDEDGNDLGTVTKSVNYSVLYMKAVKALQEAIAKIETLEGMVAVNNITIDEQQHQLSTLAARLTALESA